MASPAWLENESNSRGQGERFIVVVKGEREKEKADNRNDEERKE